MSNKTRGFWFLVLISSSSFADQLRIAVASNFLNTLNQLAVAFKAQSGHELLISSASTGQLYGQIVQSAPFDVFMAADTARPSLLLEAGLASDMQVYALGQLTLIANKLLDDDCEAILSSEKLKYLAIANPDLAPYGRAAKEFLMNSKLWNGLQTRIVMGENIMQAWQMVQTKNATAGLVAKSLLTQTMLAADQCMWLVPASNHAPIAQALVLLSRSKQQALFTEFMLFLNSDAATAIITENGYLVLSPN